MIPDDKSINSLKQQVYRLLLVLLWIALGYVLIKIGEQFKDIVFCFFVAILINYMLARPVNFLARHIKSRGLAVLSIFSAAVLILVCIIYFGYPAIVDQFIILRNSLPNLVTEIYQLLVNLNLFLLKNYQIELPLSHMREEEILNSLIGFITQVNVADASSTFMTVVTSSVNIILYIVLSLIMAFYMLIDGERAWQLFLTPFSDKLVRHLEAIRIKVNSSLNAFVSGQIQIATMTASVMLVTYLFLQIPFAVLFAFAQMLEVFPVIGTWTAIIPCIVIICLTSGLSKGIIAFTIYLLYTQFLRDNFIAPRIMGDALGLHPLAIIFAVIIGAKAGGIIGIAFALPILATINAVIDYNVELSRLKVIRHSTEDN